MTTATLTSVAASVSPARIVALVDQWKAPEAFEALRAVRAIGERRVDHQGLPTVELQLDATRIVGY